MFKLFDKYKNTGQNTKIVIKNTTGAFAVKGLSLVISVLTTPVFIKYFNDNEVLGVWFTMLSVLIWFLNFDLGIGNGLRNQLVKDFTAKDYESARCTLSSGFYSVGAVTLALTFIGSILIATIDLNSLFNVAPDLLSYRTLLISSVAIFMAVMLRFMLTTVTSIFYALQKSAINNFLALCVSILQLLFVFVFRFENVEEALINLAVAYIFLSNLPVVITGIYAFCKPLRNSIPSIKAVTSARTKVIMDIGILFFLCQILYACIANTNEFLITKLYGAHYTADYTFYYKVMTITTMIISLAMTPIWSVVTKAAAENNYVWLSKLYKRLKQLGLLVILSQFLLIPFMQIILDAWLGKGQVEVNTWTAISFACFSGIFVYSGMLSTVGNGLARMKIQTICFALGVFLKFTIDLAFFQAIENWSLVVWSNVFALIPYVIVQQVDLNRYFKNQLNINTK